MQPNGEDFRGIDWLWGGILTIITGLVAALWGTQSKRIDEINEEIKMQRGNVSKLFDKLDEHSKASAERDSERRAEAYRLHTEILNALHNGLNEKVDKS